MIFVHPLFSSPFEISEDKISVLVVENKAYYRKIIEDLLIQLTGFEGESLFYCNDVLLKPSKSIDITIDYFNIDINQSKNLTKLYNAIKNDYMAGESYGKYIELSDKIMTFMNELGKEFEYDIVYDDQLDLALLFKAINLKFALEEKDFLEKLMDYLLLLHNYFQVKLFILPNLKNFLSKEELESFYKFLFYKKIDVLLLESQINDYSEYERVRVIDQDLCVID